MELCETEMGIHGLIQFLKSKFPRVIKQINISSLDNKVLAIDASNWIYQFLARTQSTLPFTQHPRAPLILTYPWTQWAIRLATSSVCSPGWPTAWNTTSSVLGFSTALPPMRNSNKSREGNGSNRKPNKKWRKRSKKVSLLIF